MRVPGELVFKIDIQLNRLEGLVRAVARFSNGFVRISLQAL